MATNILIYDIIRIAENQYKSHYRLYNEQKNLLKESDYVYTIVKPRNMRVGELKQKIKTGIWQQSWGLKIIDKNDKMITSCLVSDDVIKQEMAPLKDPTPKIVESFAKKVDVDDNPRIYKIIEVQGHPTIVKSDSIYLTREQAKEELFNKQLGV